MSNALKRNGAGQTVSFPEAGDLRLAVGGDDDDLVEALVDAGFKKEWDIVDNDCSGTVSGNLPGQVSLKPSHAGMNDSFEQPKFGSTLEHDVTECMAIDGLIWIQNLLTECFHDRTPCWLVG